MLIDIQDLTGLLNDMEGVIAMEGYHAGSVREALIVQAHAPTRYGLTVVQLTKVRLDWFVMVGPSIRAWFSYAVSRQPRLSSRSMPVSWQTRRVRSS